LNSLIDGIAFGILTGVSVGFSAGYLGSLIVIKKMALVGDALSHVALPGLAIGILFGFNPFLGAFAFLFASAVAISHIEKVTRLSPETIVGALFTLALAIGILIMPEPELLEALFGDIASVGLLDTMFAVLFSAFAVILTRTIYKKIVLSLISEELAISTGINVSRVNLLYLLLVSLNVAIGIKVLGTLLVGFMLVVPAATAKNIANDMSKYSIFSSIFGAISAAFGIMLSSYMALPSGPSIVLSGIALFLVTVLFRWRKP